MTLHTDPDESVIQELRRRRVIRVAAAYIALCVGGVSAGALVIDLMAAPDWVFRALLGTSAMGFPVMAVLAWTYDVTPEGIVRTPDHPPSVPPGDPAPEWVWGLVVASGVLIAVASWVLRSALL